MAKRKIVEVVWDDHAFHSGQHSDHAKLGTAKQESVGYLVYQDKKIIKLAQSFTDDKDPNEVLVINKRMLISKRRVK